MFLVCVRFVILLFLVKMFYFYNLKYFIFFLILLFLWYIVKSFDDCFDFFFFVIDIWVGNYEVVIDKGDEVIIVYLFFLGVKLFSKMVILEN